MKKLIIIYIISAFSQIPQVQILQNINFQYATPISQADISNGKTFIIDQPGDYFLASNLIFSPQHDEGIIIQIATDNVTLNLNQKTISSQPYFHHLQAIQIKKDLSNIIIQNGTFNKIRGRGINIHEGCSNISLRNLLVSNCYCGGLIIKNCVDCIIDNLYLSHCINHHPEHEPFCGIDMSHSSNCIITNTFVDNFINPLGNTIGISLENCKSCEIRTCKIASNQGKSVMGIGLKNAHTCYLLNMRVILNQATHGNAYGYYYAQSSGNITSNCQAQMCQSSTGNAYGFYLQDSNSIRFDKCEGRNNDTQESPFNAYGFYATDSSGIAFRNCLSFGNKGGNTPSSIGAGYALENQCRGVFIKECTSIGNGGVGEAYGIKLGSEDRPVIDTIIEWGRIINNRGTTKQYGIKDFSPHSTTRFIGNNVIGHGQIFIGSPELKDNGKMNYMFNYNSEEKRANQMIVEGSNSFLQNIPREKFLNISLGD